MFKPNYIYYEKEIENYPLGKKLLNQYSDVPKIIIDNHNNIEELRKKSNSEFINLKRNLIIGIRKTHKFVPNHKVSDYLVPYTSSGCTAMCLYCYLVCNYNKCSYLRLFVNREQMLDKIIKVANKEEKDLTFEIGSNSDLILENTITGNLDWTIEEFSKTNKGFLTFPTKFDMVDSICKLNHKGKIIVRMSVNPEIIINKIEIGTSRLKNRVEEYENLIKFLQENLSSQVKEDLFFEIIFMTYSYVHRMINADAFPNAINLFDTTLMTGRGRGKYMYKTEIKREGEEFFREKLKKYFPKNKIIYIV